MELLICFDLAIKVVGEVKPYAGDEAKRKIDAASLNSAMVAMFHSGGLRNVKKFNAITCLYIRT